MKKKTKNILIIVAVIAVVAIAAYFFTKGKDDSSAGGDQTMSAGGDGAGAETRSTPSQISDCSNWKAKKAIQKGLSINPSWIKKHGIDDCVILEWMYHIKYETEWGKNLSGKKLFEDAEFQANEAQN